MNAGPSSLSEDADGVTERLKARIKMLTTQLTQTKKELTATKVRLTRAERQITVLDKKVADQSRVSDDQKRKLEEFAGKINEVPSYFQDFSLFVSYQYFFAFFFHYDRITHSDCLVLLYYDIVLH